MLVNQTKWLVLHSSSRGMRLTRYDQRFWTLDVALQVMCVITYTVKIEPQGLAGWQDFIRLLSWPVTILKLRSAISSATLCQGRAKLALARFVIKGMFHAHAKFAKTGRGRQFSVTRWRLT